MTTLIDDLQVRAAPGEIWPPTAFAKPKVSVAKLQTLGMPVTTVDFASIGGGIASFAWGDILRIAGMPTEKIAVIGSHPSPYGHYSYLTNNSQIPLRERIRSDSASTPDNMWGYPGYALREILAEVGQGRFLHALSIFWQIFCEPTVTDYYTPRIGDVFRSIDREATRIGWAEMYRYGRVRLIRQTDDGRFAILYSRRGGPDDTGEAPYAIAVARHIHLAVGYPGYRLLPALQRYRETTGDYESAVNAYEPHEHVYKHLRRHGGLVLVQGRGIVASRILQRIAEERKHNPNIAIIHLMRSPIHRGQRYGHARRQVFNHVEIAGFNAPRDCWGGKRLKLLMQASPEERARLLEIWNGTTTPRRRDWMALITRGLNEGWLQIVFGQLDRLERCADGRMETIVKATGAVTGELRFNTAFVIDCIGLEAEAMGNPLVNDLITTYGLQLNPLKRLHVANDFEVPGMRNGEGRMYAAGVLTFGGPHAGVDTFLGTQYAALHAVDALIDAGVPGLRRINGLRSVSQWIKWVRGIRP